MPALEDFFFFLGKPIRQCFIKNVVKIGDQAYENPNIIKAKYDFCKDCEDAVNAYMALELTDCTDPTNVVYINANTIAGATIGEVYEVEWLVVPAGNQATACYTVTDHTFFVGIFDGLVNSTTLYANCALCTAPACVYTSIGEGEYQIQYAYTGWDGEFINPSGTYNVPPRASLPVGGCIDNGETFVSTQILTRVYYQSSPRFDSPYCFWASSEPAGSDGIFYSPSGWNHELGFNTALNAWVAEFNVIYNDGGPGCSGENVWWIKETGRDPLGVYVPFTPAQLATIGQSTAGYATNGTIVVTEVP